jgi:hypothetical protein
MGRPDVSEESKRQMKEGRLKTLQVVLHRDTYEGIRHASFWLSKDMKWIVQEALDKWLQAMFRKDAAFKIAVEEASKRRRAEARKRYEQRQQDSDDAEDSYE